MTIVNRRTFMASRGRQEDVIDMLKQGTYTVPYRIYNIYYGQFDLVALEMEFGSIAEMDAAWSDWGASDEAKEFLARWVEITEPGGNNEIWTLESQGG